MKTEKTLVSLFQITKMAYATWPVLAIVVALAFPTISALAQTPGFLLLLLTRSAIFSG